MTHFPILMYHNIGHPDAKGRLRSHFVSPGAFARQMWLLARCGYRGVSMAELLPYLSGEKSGKVVGLTFDDGYCDNFEYALPTLQRYGFTATNYLVAGHLGGYNQWCDGQRVQRKELMSRNQIDGWLAAGMDIGSHTCSHVHLGKVSATEAWREIEESKRSLEDDFGVPVTNFCYPYGEYSPEVVAMVQKAGYATATTTVRGRVQRQSDLLLLPRVHVTRRTHPLLFAAKVLTAYEERIAPERGNT